MTASRSTGISKENEEQNQNQNQNQNQQRSRTPTKSRSIGESSSSLSSASTSASSFSNGYRNDNMTVTPSPHMNTSAFSAHTMNNNPTHGHEHGHASTTITTHINTPTSTPSWIPKRGLAIDMRTLYSFSGDAVGNTFRNHVISLLESSRDQGVLPTILGTTALKETKTTKTKGKSKDTGDGRMNHQPGIEAQVTNISQMKCNEGSDYSTGDEIENGNGEDATIASNVWGPLLSIVKIRPPSNMSNTKNRDLVHVPKRLLASDSWRIFGDLIDAIVLESAMTMRRSKHQLPMDITIISNDVALFTDTNDERHKRGMTRLWERLKEKFESNQIRSVKFVVFLTGIDCTLPADPAISSGTNTGSGSGSASGIDNYPSNNHFDDDIPQRFKVAHCAKIIQGHLSNLLARELKRHSGMQNYRGSPIDVCLEGKDFHPLHFVDIARGWSREIISSAAGTGCISFDLPETLNGTQCSVMLNLSYSILPYPVNSAATEGLVQNLRSWTHSSYFEVIQLVPLDEVDMSLIYGVPITATAGLDGDLGQYREMQQLVSELWKHLASRDVAIVLRCMKESTFTPAKNKTFYGDDGHRKIFLLMAQISANEREKTNLASGNGMLYQFLSNSNQILETKTDVKGDGNICDEYTDLIKCSLDMLDKTGLDPCLPNK